MQYLILIIGFVFVIKGADLLVDAATMIARRLRVSDLAIGLTIVAFGTSLPELFVNIFACVRGSTDIAIGNILGSNTFNILFILGISAIIYPLAVTKSTVLIEIPLTLLAAVLVGVLANNGIMFKTGASELSRIDGIVFLCFFLIFIYYMYGIMRKQKSESISSSAGKNFISREFLFLSLGFIVLFLGAHWVVESAINISKALGVSESLIALTIVSIGTSLPELATSAVAAYKKNADIAVGNIVGSNIFNIFFILGVSVLIKPLPFKNIGMIDILVTILASVILFIFMFTGKRHTLDRWEGVLFLILYIGYVVRLIILR